MKMKTIATQGSPKDVTFLVGTCAQDNFDIIDISEPDDIWFHVRDWSSCHVIARVSGIASVAVKYSGRVAEGIRGNSRERSSSEFKGDRELSGDNLLSHDNAKIPAGEKMDKKTIHKIIKQGALLCKEESRYKSVKNLAIIYTKVQNVQKTNIVGSVIAHPVSKICI